MQSSLGIKNAYKILNFNPWKMFIHLEPAYFFMIVCTIVKSTIAFCALLAFDCGVKFRLETEL